MFNLICFNIKSIAWAQAVWLIMPIVFVSIAVVKYYLFSSGVVYLNLCNIFVGVLLKNIYVLYNCRQIVPENKTAVMPLTCVWEGEGTVTYKLGIELRC